MASTRMAASVPGPRRSSNVVPQYDGQLKAAKNQRRICSKSGAVYRYSRSLSRGAYGTLRQGRDQQGKLWALKTVVTDPGLARSLRQKYRTSFPLFQLPEAFVEEACLLQRVDPLYRVREVIRLQGEQVMVLPWLNGADVGKCIAKWRRTMEPEAFRVSVGHAWKHGLRALARCAEVNIVHHDVKLDHLVWHQEAFRLIDFGLAKEGQAPYGHTGTPGFRAPEGLTRDRDQRRYYTHVSDVWSLAAAFVDALTMPEGEHFFLPGVLPGGAGDLRDIEIASHRAWADWYPNMALALSDDDDAWQAPQGQMVARLREVLGEALSSAILACLNPDPDKRPTALQAGVMPLS